MAAKRLYFINRFFWPDQSATSQILSGVAFALAEKGHDINIIASRLDFSDTKRRYPPIEIKNGVTIRRIYTSGYGRYNLVGRAADYLSFYITAFFAIMKNINSDDIVVVKTDPPLLSVPLGFLLRVKRAKQVNWLQDIYPETAAKLELAVFDGPLGKFLSWVRNRSLQRSHLNIAIGEIMAELLLDMGIPYQKIRIIPNFVDDQVVKPTDPENNPVRKGWGFRESDFVIGYSGNLGRAHELDTILAAAERLQADGYEKIKFLFIGGGHLHKILKEERAQRKLKNLFIKPYQPFDMIRYSMTAADVHWLSLKPELEGLIVPSKFYSAAASGRPVVMIGDPKGEIGRKIESRENGRCFAPGDDHALADFLIRLSLDNARTKKMGQKSRALIENEYSKSLALDNWHSLVSSLQP